jgi:hypothetical protein
MPGSSPFGNGMVARELIVDLDDEARADRLVGRRRLVHASQRVGPGFRRRPAAAVFVWIADLLPTLIARHIRAMIDQAASVMKPTLEAEVRADLTPRAAVGSYSNGGRDGERETKSGFLVLADISGFTEFLTSTELEHGRRSSPSSWRK